MAKQDTTAGAGRRLMSVSGAGWISEMDRSGSLRWLPCGVQSLSQWRRVKDCWPPAHRLYEPPLFSRRLVFHPVSRLPRRRAPRRHSAHHSPPYPPSTNTMIAVQKPPTMFTPPALRPTHSRHPSAPVVVRPSHTPGVLNIAKPAQSCPRPQQLQAQPRAPRASPKKQQRSPQPIHAQAASVEASKAPTTSPAKADQSSPAGDKSTRGRKQNKQLKDAHRRSVVRLT